MSEVVELQTRPPVGTLPACVRRCRGCAAAGWKRDHRQLAGGTERYGLVASRLPGGLGNARGSRALYLRPDGGDMLYRDQGTTEPRTIGRTPSNRCVRMARRYVESLYESVPIWARVVQAR